MPGRCISILEVTQRNSRANSPCVFSEALCGNVAAAHAQSLLHPAVAALSYGRELSFFRQISPSKWDYFRFVYHRIIQVYISRTKTDFWHCHMCLESSGPSVMVGKGLMIQS